MGRRTAFAAILASLLAACAVHQAAEPTSGPGFTHSDFAQATPWTNEGFDADAGKFTFAVFSDLNGGEREGIFAVAAEQLRLLRPEFIICVGDLIEAGTEDRAQLEREWDSFDQRAGRAVAPVFHVGGNHDLINPVQWDVWEQRYGRRYYWFTYKNVLFLVLDTEDNTVERQWEINQARNEAIERIDVEGWAIYDETEYGQMPETPHGSISAEQSEYFRDVIAEHPDVRWTFVFLHKPTWLREGEQNFLAIEQALSDRPYTVFNGHQHDYLYRSRNGRDYIQLGTTGGVQQEGKQKAVDHLTLVTVSDSGVDIANIEMAGIFDKSGHIPLNGEELCFDAAECGEQ